MYYIIEYLNSNNDPLICVMKECPLINNMQLNITKISILKIKIDLIKYKKYSAKYITFESLLKLI